MITDLTLIGMHVYTFIASHRLATPSHPLFPVSMVTEVKEENPNKREDAASLRQQWGYRRGNTENLSALSEIKSQMTFFKSYR